MTNDRANLVNPKPLGDEVADGLAATVVKVEVVDRGAILDGGIPSAAEQNIERRPCDCEYGGWGIVCRRYYGELNIPKDLCRIRTERHLP